MKPELIETKIAAIQQEMWRSEVFVLTSVAALYAWALANKAHVVSPLIWIIPPAFWLLWAYRVWTLGQQKWILIRKLADPPKRQSLFWPAVCWMGGLIGCSVFSGMLFWGIL